MGEHANCRPTGGDNALGLEQVVDDLIRPLAISTLYHVPIGHGRLLATLPIGVHARLEATGKRLHLLDSGVC
jgi:muramoyltetrapeptide carboxypeptidase